jgi:hypothetical protein
VVASACCAAASLVAHAWACAVSAQTRSVPTRSRSLAPTVRLIRSVSASSAPSWPASTCAVAAPLHACWSRVTFFESVPVHSTGYALSVRRHVPVSVPPPTPAAYESPSAT